MQITFYRSNLCPRCMLAKKWLKELATEHPDVEIVEVDVLAHPIKAWCDGVRLIPTLKSNEKQLSGLLLTRGAIAAFLKSII